ncbi:MAG: hypothetical protein JXP34_17450 [Planctomycetes bacterium]|nr:hypothetical protein [Planctomycetota bacterium]
MGSESRRQKKLQKKAAKRKVRQREVRARGMPADDRGWIRRSAAWPIKEARLGWDERMTLASVLVSRQAPDGVIAAGSFLVDIGCLGVKSAFARIFFSEDEYRDFVRDLGRFIEMRRRDPAYAAKVIESGLAYARDLGFAPDPDYRWSKHVLEGIDSSTCPEKVACGKDGKPFYVSGPNDDDGLIMRQLRERLGPDGFHFLAGIGSGRADGMDAGRYEAERRLPPPSEEADGPEPVEDYEEQAM